MWTSLPPNALISVPARRPAASRAPPPAVGDVTRDGRVVVESQLVSQLLDEMDEVLRAGPKSQPGEVAEVIARRIDEAGGAERR
jgi:predicted alpha/beta-hydrolase family hydrolase